MRSSRRPIFCASLAILQVLIIVTQTASYAATKAKTQENEEKSANSMDFPTQILKSGVVLNSRDISPNGMQLGETIGLIPIINTVQQLRAETQAGSSNISPDYLNKRQDLIEATQRANNLIQRTNLEIDFTIAEIEAEDQVYEEILATFTSDRDKLVARVNAASFISNGILWAACEGMSIPSINTTFSKNPRNVVQWPIPAGIVGIAAGIVPSIASMYTLKAVNGKKKTSEVEPNMLAKLFNYPINSEIDYPNSVWQYLHQTPADAPKAKTRLNQLIDRWVADANMPAFTDRESKAQLDILTASASKKKGLNISTLTARIVMLRQLHAEVLKMKRMLLELSMAVEGEKVIAQSDSGTVSPLR